MERRKKEILSYKYKIPEDINRLYQLALLGDNCGCGTCFICQCAQKYTDITEEILGTAECSGINVDEFRKRKDN